MKGSNLPLGEWFRILPSAVSGCPMSPVHILHHLPCLCTWGKRWCAPPVVMYLVMADEIIYVGPSPVGNLKNQDLRGVGIIICHIGRMTQRTKHNTTLHYTILHHTILHYTTLQYNTIQYNTIQYNNIVYYAILYHIILHFTTQQHITPHYTIQLNVLL